MDSFVGFFIDEEEEEEEELEEIFELVASDDE